MWDSRHLGTVIDFGSQMRAMTVEDRPQLCGATTSLGMGGFGKTSRRYISTHFFLLFSLGKCQFSPIALNIYAAMELRS